MLGLPRFISDYTALPPPKINGFKEESGCLVASPDRIVGADDVTNAPIDEPTYVESIRFGERKRYKKEDWTSPKYQDRGAGNLERDHRDSTPRQSLPPLNQRLRET